MYRTQLNHKDKTGAIIAVVAVHVALLMMLLQISGKMDFTKPDSVLRVISLNEIPPPPPVVVTQSRPEQKPKPKESEGAASPQNVKSKATDVPAPRPPISLPVPVPMEVSKTPSTGTQATQGAANPGPGTGAGGTGNGTGNGGSGNGTGGGGGGGYVVPPQLLTPVLRGRDFPRQMLEAWPRGAELFVRIRVNSAGGVAQCIVDRGTGNPAVDQAVCGTIQQRFRFSPARSREGQAVAGWFGYRQVAPQ